MNPGPSHSEMFKYKKRTGHSDMKGEMYEIKMSALLYLRALQTGQPFLLASNMDAAGTFDDVVLTLGDITMFLQLKHKEKSDTILRLSHLTRDKQFNLPKYLKSYLDIKKRWQDNPDLQRCGRFEDAKFVIFTNARVDENLVNAAGSAEVLNIISTGGTCVCLTELFDSLPKYKAVLSAAVSTENVTATPELWEVVHKLYSKQTQALPSKRQLQEILEQLESLGDLASYKQFISQLYLCTGQMAEKDLDQEILPYCGTDTVLWDFMDGVQDWWRKSRCYLTFKAKFFQGIIHAIAANITKDVSTLKVRFIENECDTMRQKLISGNRKIYLKTGCTRLSCIKVLQSFKKSILVDVDTLQIHLSEVLAIWRLGVCDVLVVEGETTDTSVLQKFASMPDSKCVVMISVNEQPQSYQQFKFTSCIDSFCLNQLDLDSQRAVLEHVVMFQGFPVKLNSLADVSFLQSTVTADTVVQLHNTLHIGHKLDDLDPCYIPRTFLRREYVSEKIFREKKINLAITGISEDRLAHLLPVGERVQKLQLRNCNIGTAYRYFFIEVENEFTALCSMKNNIHWIESCDEGFVWKKSKGDMSALIEHLEQKYVSYAGVEEVLALPHQLVLVVAEPGMGKSTEMFNIANMIKQKDPSTWVIRVDLNKHTTLLSQNQINAVEFLETVATLNTDFQKQLFEHQLEFGGNVVILLDGFDEISPNYSKRVFDLLTKFCDSKARKIFVTSRPVMIKELQDKLSVLAFSVHAFTPEAKEKFLARHWNQTLNVSFSLSNFISSLLQLVETSLNDKLKEFTGNPLQCMMIAEVFQGEALHYCQTGEMRLPQCLNVLQLYDKFVEKKWQVYCKKLYGDVSNAMLQIFIENQKLQYQQSIMCCALVSYFHEDDISRLYNSEYILKQNQEFVHMFVKGQDKSGIVNGIINNKTVFAHQTFTEYFVAMWFLKHLKLELHNINHLYLDKKFYTVRQFLDRMLAKEMKLHTAVLNEDLVELRNLLSEQNIDTNEKDGGGRTVLHLAIMNYFNTENKIDNSIIETLLEHGADVNCEDRVLHWRPLRLAEKIRAWYVVEKLLEKQADGKDLVLIKRELKKQLHIQNQVARLQDFRQSVISVFDTITGAFITEVLFTALREGHVNLVEFILNCGVSVGQYHKHNTSMLHVAAEHGQLRMVQLLINRGDCINKKWRYGSPLVTAAERGHVKIAELLIHHGASLNARDKDGYTALLIGAYNGQNEIVELMLQKGADVEMSGGEGNTTPLMLAAERGHMQIVELLINHGASLTARDKYGDTALLIGAYMGQNEIVELLLQKGADVEMSGGEYNRTPLMHAAEFGNVQIVELLINHGVSVNARDKDGNTALLIGAYMGQNEIVELLLQKGADVEMSGGEDNRTPLMHAAEFGHVQIVELLINHGASVNARDKDGYTALLIGAYEGQNEIVELLLQKGADVEMSGGEDNRTPLMQAAIHGHVQIVELLINHGASVNARDTHGYTALLIVVYKGQNEIVKLLLQKGFDVEMSGGEDNRTPLMQAAIHGHMQIVELLINHGASLTARDKYGDTALLIGAYKGQNEIVELLLQKGADVEMSGGENNRTPLMHAAEFGHVQIVELLLNHGISVNARDKDGYTALLIGAYEGQNEIVELLLQKGADVEMSGGEDNRTPLMHAAEIGHVQIVELLINHGVSVNARDKDGDTALLIGAYEGQNEIVELLLQKVADVEMSGGEDNRTPLMLAAIDGHMQIVELLINHGASVNARDKDGYTALLIGVYKGQNEIVELLLQKGSDVEMSGGDDNRTPLMLAAIRGHMQIVELLINHGASLFARDKYGDTALLIGAYMGQNEIVELLLQKGADVEMSGGEYNRTPLMQAAIHGHMQIVELLINHGASVNARDTHGYTALLIGAYMGQNEIVELLLQKGADVEMSGGEDNRTPLMLAAIRGHMQIVELLINHGASVNARDKDGYTALLIGVYKGQNEIVELLLQKGSDVEMSGGEDNRTPLMQAAIHGHMQIVELLINHGASVNARDTNGYTALLIGAYMGQNEIVELLLQKGADVEMSGGEDNRTPLMLAAIRGHIQIVELLINHGASVNARDKDGYTALLIGVYKGQNEIVELLLQKGSDVEMSGGEDNRTPLMQAAIHGHMQIVELLINHGASVNARDKDGYTALLIGVYKGQNEIVELLLQKGSDVEMSGGEDNRTPLMQAAIHGHMQIVELLINHGVSVNARDKDGYTALLIGVYKGQNEIVELLLQKGSDVEMSGGEDNRTPLMLAAIHGHMQIVELLINHGASVNARDKDGYTALLIGVYKGQNEIVELMLQKGSDVEMSGGEDNRTPLMLAAIRGQMQIVELLINHGASLTARDKYDDTALLIGAYMGQNEIVELLLQKGSDVEMSGGEDNRTPLMLAAIHGHMQIVELLINHGASVNARDTHGYTALLIGAYMGQNEIVELLLQKGSDVEMSGGEDNRTPLMHVAEFGHVQIVELLINHGASLTARDKYGDTALLIGVYKGQNEIVELMLQKGSDVEMSGGEDNRTPLMLAAIRGQMQIVELLINHGASLTARDKYDDTALLIGAYMGQNEIVELLLQKGADVEMSGGEDNRTPLMHAAEIGHMQIVELLINHGASLTARDKYGDTALLIGAYEGQNEIVELLLQKGADVEMSGGEYNRTPLMLAAIHGHMQIVELLINHGASLTARDKYGDTALLIGAYEGQNEIVELLLQKGADVEMSGGEYNRTPLMLAAIHGHMQIVELLINHGASVNARDTHGYTALSLALTNNHNNVVELLLQHGAQK